MTKLRFESIKCKIIHKLCISLKKKMQFVSKDREKIMGEEENTGIHQFLFPPVLFIYLFLFKKVSFWKSNKTIVKLSGSSTRLEPPRS